MTLLLRYEPKTMALQVPWISVVMINRNYEDMIGDAIRSVLNQTWREWELIIVDNSTDKSMDVIRRFEDERMKAYHIENRIFLGAARNIGIEKSNPLYRYIAYLDSDDIWYENHLEVEAEYLNTHPFAGLVSTALWDQEYGNILGPQVKEFEYPYIIRPSSWMHRRILLRHISIDRSGNSIDLIEKLIYYKKLRIWGQ